jgi:hypothetical protein
VYGLKDKTTAKMAEVLSLGMIVVLGKCGNKYKNYRICKAN